jgi:hypothetical protein
MANKTFKKAIKNFIGKSMLSYITALEAIIKINDKPSITLTFIYRFVLTLPAIIIALTILYYFCKAWTFMVGIINAMAWGINC